MLSHVTKSADALRGATQYQDLWSEIEKAHPVKPRAKPRALQDHMMNALTQEEAERRKNMERLAHERQQANNFYLSPEAQNLTRRKARVPLSERKVAQQRLCHRSIYRPARPKSATNVGFITADGMPAVFYPLATAASTPKPVPKSRAKVSPPDGAPQPTERRRNRPAFDGLTRREFYNPDWGPAMPYRPAVHDKPWEHLKGFAASTQTLERRKLDPKLDINSFQANKASAAALNMHDAYVRPIDASSQNKGLQAWKETLREDFAREEDNYSTSGQDILLDELRKSMGVGTGFEGVHDDGFQGFYKEAVQRGELPDKDDGLHSLW